MSADEATPKRRKEDRLPWFPFFVNDWDCDIRVRRMGHAARGMFLSLLLMQWREGSIPGDVLELIRLLHVPPDPIRSPTGPVEGEYQVDVEACLERVLLCFVSDGKGGLVNERMEEIRLEQNEKRDSCSERGRHGGLRKARNRSQKLAELDVSYSLATSKPLAKPSDLESDTDIELKPRSKANTALRACVETKEAFPPSMDQVTTYCRERKNQVDPSKWFDFYQSKGWLIGKSRMKDWRAAVRTWERNGYGGPLDDGRKTAAQRREQRFDEMAERACAEAPNPEDIPGSV